jgi:catenin beta 1
VEFFIISAENIFFNDLTIDSSVLPFTGYDTLPIDSMQGLEIGGNSQQQNLMGGMNTNPPTSPSYQMDMECVIGEMDASELTFQHHLGVDSMMDTMPSPPANDSNTQAAWYDTDL